MSEWTIAEFDIPDSILEERWIKECSEIDGPCLILSEEDKNLIGIDLTED